MPKNASKRNEKPKRSKRSIGFLQGYHELSPRDLNERIPPQILRHTSSGILEVHSLKLTAFAPENGRVGR